ncbi:carboxypeptidase-like regulatory domain-containing protein [Lutibacter sp.]|uniref:carboxypeptidase-like regulatory domain-containing protein n=1 Tax=Lutibacter sp. TaxID=1925666 RepID=UPI0025B95614|nr:carboxypeptidase-like regulatory domain-containing protein [Lutibacter sp.]MCF6182270.1 carboxypeptidase-like regulatory domain-containing protein [Lutibacter sp.]
MKKITVLLFLLSFSFSFSQSTIEGFIFDRETKTSLPYATIKIISSNNYYTITNEDGKFEIKSKFPTDSIEVRFIGFKTKKITVSYFKKHSKLYLTPNTFHLNQVLVVAKKNKNYTYNLLNSLIKKYRDKQTVTNSKAFLTLTSSARGIPIETIEGFYNSEQNLSKGIVGLQLKSGRFGQNASFPFYSLNNTDILKDFQLFEKSSQILPLYPGNLTLGIIKGKYRVKMDECVSCSQRDLSISFTPKKANGHFLSGTIIFNKETLTIKKIKLSGLNPITNGLSSIIEDDIITPKSIQLNINFNPNDYTKIQSLDFEFTMNYNSKDNFEIITSHSLLYFYDYNTSFEEPYFTNNIHFNNDYDKIRALKASDEFWNLNYQFPRSYKEKMSLDFLKKYGYLINYNTTIPSDYLQYIRPSIITWQKNKPLKWQDIKLSLLKDVERNVDHKDYQQGATKAVDKESFSISEFKHNKNKSELDEQFNFSYMLDMFINERGEKQFNTKTLFDRNSSFCSYNRINSKLMYINLIFDIYEIYNRELKVALSKNSSFEDAKILCDQKFNEASLTIKKIATDTNNGTNFQNLIRWSEKVKQKLKK